MVLDADGAVVTVGIGVSIAQVDVVEILVLQFYWSVAGVGGIEIRIVEDSLEGFLRGRIVTGDHVIPFDYVIMLAGIVVGIYVAGAAEEVEVVPENRDHRAGTAGIGQAPVAPVGIVCVAKGDKAVGRDRNLSVIHAVI